MTADHETIQLRIEARTAWITFDRPPLNILHIPMMEALDRALGRALPKADFVGKCSRHFTLCFAGWLAPIA